MKKKRTSPCSCMVIILLISFFTMVVLCLMAMLTYPVNQSEAVELSEDEEKSQWGHVSILNLTYDPDNYTDQQVHYIGEVFNLERNSSGLYMQIMVEQEAVVAVWRGVSEGIHGDTTVEFWGIVRGAGTGTNRLGETITQPVIDVKYMTVYR